jgi:hypothetical protein
MPLIVVVPEDGKLLIIIKKNKMQKKQTSNNPMLYQSHRGFSKLGDDERAKAARKKFGRKPTYEEAYERILHWDEDFADALELAYPELYKEVMQGLAKDPSYDAPPPPYARLYSGTGDALWRRRRKEVLAAAASHRTT